MSAWLKRRKKRLEVMIYGAGRGQNTVAGVRVRRLDESDALGPPSSSLARQRKQAKKPSPGKSPSSGSGQVAKKSPPCGGRARVTVFTSASRRAFRFAILAKEEDIRTFLQKGVSKASIARIMEVSSTTLHHFVRTRKLQARMASPR